MKKLLLLLFAMASYTFANAQCTTTNATSCQCRDSSQSDCDLLPDIQIGHPPFYDLGAQYGVIEYSQTGNGVDNGRLRVTVSTPNPGMGPLEIHTTNVFVCGTDTFVGTAPSICPDGVTFPRIVIEQRVYHKGGNTMSYYDRFAGTMTYHPSHGHMHVDNWGNYSLRTMDSTQSNPLLWPIIGQGTKLAFCVMDYGTCQGWPDHCMDTSGTVSLNLNSDFPNYGLGGGSYGCSSVTQGISSGYMDVYWTSLDGMWIDLPKGLCNGDYWIVCEVDPNNFFLEEDETNNVYAAPFTITKQLDTLSNAPLLITVANSATDLCPGESTILTVNNPMVNNTYLWSNGATTKSISVSTAGTYTVEVNSQCGTATSLPVTINFTTAPPSPVTEGDTIAVPGSAILQATSGYTVNWYAQPVGDTVLATGSLFNTPFIDSTTTFYAEADEPHPGAAFSTGLADSIIGGVGGYYNGDQSMIFDCYNTFILHTVSIYSPSNQPVVVDLNKNGVLVQSVTVQVVPGQNTVTLDMLIQPGNDYYLTRGGTSDLYRNNPTSTNVGYPFDIPNFCSIKTSTAGDEFYYFFYDWKIKMPDHDCLSPRVPVQAVVLNPVSASEIDFMKSFSVYPNPAKNAVTVSFRTTDKDCQLQIINSLGQISQTKHVTTDNGTVKETMDVSQLSRGVYNVHILSAGKNYYHKVVIN